MDAWTRSPESGVSYHYCVGKGGEVHQYVRESDVAWHAGIVNGPSWSLLKAGVNPNLQLVGIAREGYWYEDMTEAQYRGLVALTREVVSRHGIEPGPETLIGHYRVNSVDRPRCPGPGFPWARLFRDLDDIAGEEGPVDEKVVRKEAHKAAGIPYSEESAFLRYAREHGLGGPETPEFDFECGGIWYRGQGFARAIVYAKVGAWQSIGQLTW